MLDREQTILASAKTDGRKYYFMICDVCFWCTSVFEPHLSKYCGSFFHALSAKEAKYKPFHLHLIKCTG
jgi:hypothetical protein